MPNRILRLDTPGRIQQLLPEYLNKKINIVLNDNSVQLVELMRVSGTLLTVRNMRRQQLTVPVADIYEIIIDQNA